MVFTVESGVVKVWVSAIKSGDYMIDQVPQLYNLKEVVTQVITK